MKAKVGDVLQDGGIVVAAEFDKGTRVLHQGVVIIHKSRLRRAQRFGWKVNNRFVFVTPLPADAICVSKGTLF